MGIRDMISNIGEKSREKRHLVNQLAEEIRLQRIAEERQLSPNERELNQHLKERREKKIEEALMEARKERKHNINFETNPLNAKNVVGKTEWEVLKTKHIFSGNKNNLLKQKNIFLSKKRCY